jgi:hypothetical protein
VVEYANAGAWAIGRRIDCHEITDGFDELNCRLELPGIERCFHRSRTI